VEARNSCSGSENSGNDTNIEELPMVPTIYVTDTSTSLAPASPNGARAMPARYITPTIEEEP
jgi:hypothetical protein